VTAGAHRLGLLLLVVATYLEMFWGIDHFLLLCGWCQTGIHAAGKHLVGDLLLLAGRLEGSGCCRFCLLFFLTQANVVGWHGLLRRRR